MDNSFDKLVFEAANIFERIQDGCVDLDEVESWLKDFYRVRHGVEQGNVVLLKKEEFDELMEKVDKHD